jgi:hypothetical protein
MTVGRDYIIQSGSEGKAVKLDAAGNEIFMNFSETLRAVFTGDSRALLDNFTNYFTETGGVWTMGLVPSGAAVRSFASRIIMTGDSVIRTIVLQETGGGLLEYKLANHSFPGELSVREKAFFTLPE